MPILGNFFSVLVFLDWCSQQVRGHARGMEWMDGGVQVLGGLGMAVEQLRRAMARSRAPGSVGKLGHVTLSLDKHDLRMIQHP